MCLIPDMWRGSPAEAEVLKDINKPSGEEWEFQARIDPILSLSEQHLTSCLIQLLGSVINLNTTESGNDLST